MVDSTASVAGLLRARLRILELCTREGVKSISIERSTTDRDAYMKIDFPRGADTTGLARVQTALKRAMPLSKPTWNGVVFPLVDLRGAAAAELAARIVGAFHRFFVPDADSPAEARSITKGLRYESIEADGNCIVVDGHSSRIAQEIVTTAVESLFRKGKDEDVEKLVALLAAPPGKGPPADAAKLRKELEGLVAGLVKPRTLIRYAAGAVSATGTHLRGPAYIEEGETWPSDSAGPMSLFMQIAKGGPIELPKGVALLQIFLGESEIPYDRSSPALKLKTYARLQPKKQVAAPKTKERVPPRLKPHGIEGVKDGSVPDVESLPGGAASKRILELCKALEPLAPEDAYAAASARFVKEPEAWSFAGGWPRWLQGPARVPAKSAFVLQLGSQPKPDINWADSGVVHLFYGDRGLEWHLESC